MQTTIIYHAHCQDGRGAALAAWLALGDASTRYLPLAYGAQLPDDITPGTDLYFLDITLKRPTMLAAAWIAGRITIIDHHQSALNDLAGLPEEAAHTIGACEIRTTCNLAYSGAVLAWKHFHPDTETPDLLRFIEDRDLWRFEHQASKPLHYALEAIDDFRDLAPLVRREECLWDAINKGAAILAHLSHQWDQIAARAAALTTTAWGDDTPIIASYANCPPMWFSDVGHRLLELHAPRLAVLYHDTQATQRRTYSLRSAEDGPDCATLAAHFGGGGHRHAAGFTLPLAGPQPFSNPSWSDIEDADLFRAWIANATQNPGVTASALCDCLTADDYRAALRHLAEGRQEAA
jgi:uncharacterized protein